MALAVSHSFGSGMEIHPHQLLPSVFEAPPEEYVIALHDYEPPSVSPLPPSTPSFSTDANGKRRSTQTAHVCLAFMAGDRIRVLNRDASGWWDGELMVCEQYMVGSDAGIGYGQGTSEDEEGDIRQVRILRGWFPSNFVEDAGDRVGLREVPPQNHPNPSFRPYTPLPASNSQSSPTSQFQPRSYIQHQPDVQPPYSSSIPHSGSGFSSFQSNPSDLFHRRASEANSEASSSYKTHRSQTSSVTGGGGYNLADSSSFSSSGMASASSRRGGPGMQRGSLAASALMSRQHTAESIERSQSSMGYNRPQKQASVDDGRSQSSMGHYRTGPEGHTREQDSMGYRSDLVGHRRSRQAGGREEMDSHIARYDGRSHQVADSHGSSAILYNRDRRMDRSFSTDTTDTAMSASSTSTSGGLADEQDVELVLEPVVQAIALVKAAVISRRHAHFQPSTACVISTIRSLLAATNCLSKESPLLATFPALGKIRKLILANLAELVALARSASSQSAANGRSPDVEEDEMREMEMEGMVKSADETLGNVREFLIMVVRCGESLPEKRSGDYPVASAGDDAASDRRDTRTGDTSRQRFAPGSGDGPSATIGRSSRPSSGTQARALTPSGSLGATNFAFPAGQADSATIATTATVKRDRKSSMHARSVGDLRLARKKQGESISTAEGAPQVPSLPHTQLAREKHREQNSVSSMASNTSSRSSSSDFGAEPVTPVSSINGSALSSTANSSEVQTAVRQTEDQLLSVIAALIGHAHSHTLGSHPSSLAQLIDLTRETVDRIKELLTIVEAVLDRYSTRSPCPREVIGLDQAQANMYETCGDLVSNVERIATPLSGDEGNDEDVRKAGVIHSATATLRMGASCISLVKAVATRQDFSALAIVDADSHLSSDQARPRRPGMGSRRNKSVGQRGEHTLSALGRKASNLDSLHLKYERDGYLAPISDDEAGSSAASFNEEEEEEEEQQEVMVHGADEEDLTMQPGSFIGRRPSLRSTHTSPLITSSPNATFESTPVAPSRRNRANSMSSPMTPRLLQHRSPSRSADLNLMGGDLTFAKTPKQGDSMDTFTRRPSVADSVVSNGTLATPRPPGWQEPRETARVRQQSNNLEVPGLSRFVMPLNSRQEANTEESAGHTATDMRMWLVAHDYSPKEISFNTDGQITGATLEVLVEKMTPPDVLVDPVFWETFFLTFRLFTTPSRLLESLELRYDLAPPVRMPLSPATIKLWNERKLMPVRLRIFNFLKTWLDLYWDTQADQEVIHALNMFIEERLTNALPVETPRLRELLAKRTSRPASIDSRYSSGPVAQVKNRQKYQSGSPTSPLYSNTFFNPSATTALPPTPIMGKQLFNSLRNCSTVILITDFHALELARQLTLMESKLFGNVSAEDLLNSGRKRAESLTAMSTLSNRITGWVADNILNEQDAKKRATLLKFFIKLADRCLSLNNYSSLFAILAGLNSSTILRLKKTWGGLSTKYRVIMDQLRTLIEHTRNHNNYRTKLRSVDGPALPFLGLILTDITFTSDGNPNTRPSTLDPDLKLINFDKYTKLGRIAMDFQRYQMPFNLAALPDCQSWLERVLAEKGSSSIDALYRKSLVLEPRIGSESIPSSTFEKPSWLQGRI